jgi:hypothetical protein
MPSPASPQRVPPLFPAVALRGNNGGIDTARLCVIWNGAMDRAGTCPSLVDGRVRRPSTLGPVLPAAQTDGEF